MLSRYWNLSYVVLLVATAAFCAEVKIVEEIAVKVNGDVVTKSDLAERQHKLRQMLQQEEHLSGPALDTAVEQHSKDMLRDMVDERLLVHKAKELDIKVDADVTRRMSELQVMSGMADPDKFHDWVRQETGESFEEYKQQQTDQTLIHRLIESEVSSHIVVPEPDMRKYYADHMKDFVRKDQVYLSQLVISTANKTPEQVAAAQKKAEDLVARARRGEKFSELVIANSDDPETSRAGGQLPPQERGIMMKAIDDVVFNPKNAKGYVTDPIKIRDGILILRIEDRTEAGQATFDEAKEQIQEFLARPKMEPKYRDFLNKLRQQAFLEIKDGYIDTGAVPGKDTRWHEVVGLKPETTTKEEVAAHRKRKKFLGVIAHGSVAPGTKETSGGTGKGFTPTPDPNKAAAAPAEEAVAPPPAEVATATPAAPATTPVTMPATTPVTASAPVLNPPAAADTPALSPTAPAAAPAPVETAPPPPPARMGPLPPTPPIVIVKQ
jgi:peptidyl-prolyl cis-trans isomerase SurA